MKAKQVGNKLILTWEKGDEIKIGETITIELENKPSEECIECKKNNGKWCDKHREEAIIEACSPRKTNTDQYTEDMPSTQSPHPLTTLQEKMRREIEKTLKKYTGFDDLNDELYPGTEVFKDMFKLLSQAIATAYEQGVKDGIKTLAHRIDCNTVISELYGWKSIVEMSEDEALKELLIHTK